MTAEDKKELMKRFLSLQEERVQTYNLFDEGHKAYLAEAPNYNFPMYKQLVHEITETFKKISDEIISIQKKFDEEKEVSEILSKVQSAEKDKLNLTAKLQLAKQNVVDNPEKAEEFEDEVKTLESSLRTNVEEINEHLEDLKFASEGFMES